MMKKDLKELLLAFNAHDVEYLVVGGYAVGVHAEPRATKDLDLFIRASRENSEAVFRALAAYGAPLQDLSPANFRDEPDSVFQIGLPPFRIDILQQIDGISFDEAWKARIQGFVEGEVPAHVISRKHLIQNKLKSGRAQDLADVEAIRGAALERSVPTVEGLGDIQATAKHYAIDREPKEDPSTRRLLQAAKELASGKETVQLIERADAERLLDFIFRAPQGRLLIGTLSGKLPRSEVRTESNIKSLFSLAVSRDQHGQLGYSISPLPGKAGKLTDALVHAAEDRTANKTRTVAKPKRSQTRDMGR